MTENNLKEKYIATLIGCAIGDALGMSVECFSKEQIKKSVGKVTGFIEPLSYLTKDLKKGEYTDDTILTLAIAESIAEKKCLDFNHIIKKQIDAYEECKLPDGRTKGGFGGSTIKAFEKIKSGISPLESGVEPGLGNGVCMKISPIGIYMDTDQESNYKILETIRLIGESTHKDERAIATGIAQADAIFNLLQNNLTKEEFIDYLICSSETYEQPFNKKFLPEKGTLLDRLKWVQENKNTTEEKAYEKLGNACPAIESYPFTIFMFQKYWNKPLEGLIETVNWGGDCDTTGAMYGALAGAKNGMIFPEKWLSSLQNRRRLEQVAEKIYNLKKNDF